MLRTEIAEAVKNINIYELAQKTEYAPLSLSADEKLVSAELDKHFREIGETGSDNNREIATFIQRVVEEELYNAPDEILDFMFDRGTIGEFDDIDLSISPKNTLVAYESAKGGNVPRSFLDISKLTTTTKHLQVETEISYADIRKNGWKSIATLTNFAVESLKNKMFNIIFSAVSNGIASGADNYITEANNSLTATTMDAVALYVNDRVTTGQPVIVALNKYIQQASKLTNFVSGDMKNEVHQKGKLGMYDGIQMRGISAAHKLGDGTLQFPDRLMLGIAGKIGEIDTKGAVRVYETMDNNDEKCHIKVTGFEFTYAFNNTSLEKVCKVVMTR